MLHPGRTLIEKLLRMNNFASKRDAREGVGGWSRIGRQFYDIWALLGTQEVIDFLEDRPLVMDTLASCYETSRAFKPDFPPPPGGFAASPAFDAGGPLGARLRAEHAMESLYYGIDAPPNFDDVLDRVHEHRELLDPEALQ